MSDIMVMRQRSYARLSAAAACTLLVLAAPLSSPAQMSVLDSPHNLSVSGGKGKHQIRLADDRVCAFCHTPHNATVGDPTAPYPLWGRNLPDISIYKPYVSSTLKADPKPDRPNGSSRLCLSCHDGTIALAQFVGSRITTSTTMPSDTDIHKNPNLTTDLSDDHPISFRYTEDLATFSGQLASPSTLPSQVRLDALQYLQCTTCHDPHDYTNAYFLVMDNSASGTPLCVVCHKNTGWGTSAHNPTNTVSMTSACLACHYVHNAPKPMRLLHSVKEEDNCLASCHDSNGPAIANVKPLFSQLYRHPVDQTTGVHDENELLPAQNAHVECVDCHNPHQATKSNIPLSTPPAVNGPLMGVRIDSTGTVATSEYQICFKCHSGANSVKFAGTTVPLVSRMIMETDEQKRFNGANPSFHPVLAQRRGTGASLLPQVQTTMLTIYCTSCHNSDQSAVAGGGGPNGPHGSQYQHILMARYDMPLPAVSIGQRLPYSANLYDLCYRCHSETYIMGPGSGFYNSQNGLSQNEHAKHVQERRIACFVCHDPHGISSTSGTTQGNAHLINFNKDYAAGASWPTPSYTSGATPGLRSCAVNCHSTGTTPNVYTHYY